MNEYNLRQLGKYINYKEIKMEEIIKLKADIFDIIRQQEVYITNANQLQQKRTEKLQELKEKEQNGTPEDIIKIKSQGYDIIIQQELYISETNRLQQIKTQELQKLNELEQNIQQSNIDTSQQPQK